MPPPATRFEPLALLGAALVVVLIAYEMIDASRFATLGPGPWLALAGALIAAAAPVVRPWDGSPSPPRAAGWRPPRRRADW